MSASRAAEEEEEEEEAEEEEPAAPLISVTLSPGRVAA